MENLTINHDIFEPMRKDFNSAIDQLFSIMAETKRNAGKISLNLSVELTPNVYTDPATGEFKSVLLPAMAHKIKVSVKNEGSVQGISMGDYELTISSDGAKIGTVDDGQESMFEKEAY